MNEANISGNFLYYCSSFSFKKKYTFCVIAGDGEDYLALSLRDGAVTLNINLGSGKLDVQIRPPRVRFDDNQWHRVNIHRKAQEVLYYFTIVLYKNYL